MICMWHWLNILKVKLLLEQRFSNYCITAPRVTKNLLIKKIEQQLSPFFVNNIQQTWNCFPTFSVIENHPRLKGEYNDDHHSFGMDQKLIRYTLYTLTLVSVSDTSWRLYTEEVEIMLPMDSQKTVRRQRISSTFSQAARASSIFFWLIKLEDYMMDLHSLTN